MADQRLVLEVILENGKFKTKIAEVDKSVRKFDKTTKSSSLSIASSFKNILKSAGFIGLLIGFKKIISAASNLQEQTGKFKVVFSGHLKEASKAVDELVASYAMSTREARQYMASVQDLLVPMGMASGAATKMSGEVVKLAADLGSFNNMPTSEVIANIQSALTGMAIPMKKYGVILTEARIKQEALNSKLWGGKGAIDASAKAQAIWNLIQKDSKAAVGDMLRTATSFANTMKFLKATLEDTAAEIGNSMLPGLTVLLRTFRFLNTETIGFGIIVGRTFGTIAAGLAFFVGMVGATNEVIRVAMAKMKMEMYGAAESILLTFSRLTKVLPGFSKQFRMNLLQTAQNMGTFRRQAEVEYHQSTAAHFQYKALAEDALEAMKKTWSDSSKKITDDIKKIQKALKTGTTVASSKSEKKDPFAEMRDALDRYHNYALKRAEWKAAEEEKIEMRAANFYQQMMLRKLALTQTTVSGIQALTATAAVFMAEKNKKLFRFGQALAIAQAWINIALAVTKVLSQLGVFGPPAAAVIMAAGVLQTKKIAAQKPPEFAVGQWEIERTMPAVVHAGEMIIPKPFAESVRSGEASVTGAGAESGDKHYHLNIDGRPLFEFVESSREERAGNVGKKNYAEISVYK